MTDMMSTRVLAEELCIHSPKKVWELEDAERELAARLEQDDGLVGDFELGVLTGKLEALRWALGAKTRIRA